MHRISVGVLSLVQSICNAKRVALPFPGCQVLISGYRVKYVPLTWGIVEVLRMRPGAFCGIGGRVAGAGCS